MPYIRVVRFTDVSPERVDQLVSEIDQAAGPPPGVDAHAFQILLDRDQGTSVVLQMFETAEAMAAAEAALDAMDAGETPGTRASIDRCEVKLELSM